MGQRGRGNPYVASPGNLQNSPNDIIFSTSSQSSPGNDSPNICFMTGDVADNGDNPGQIKLETGQRPDGSFGNVIIKGREVFVGSTSLDQTIAVVGSSFLGNTGTFEGINLARNSIIGTFPLDTGLTSSLAIQTGPSNGAGADDASSGNILLASGNAGSAGGDSGNVIIQSGTAPLGTRGEISLEANIVGLGVEGSTAFPLFQIIDDAGSAIGNGSGIVTVAGALGILKTQDVDPGPTLDLIVQTGDSVGGDSGDLFLTTGTATGSRGEIDMLQAPSRNVVWKTGATAARPATPEPGERFFDITLDLPIWRNAANTDWIDAAGNIV